MPMGSSGVSLSSGAPVASSMEHLVELMRFFGDKDAVAKRMAEFAATESEVNKKLDAVGGLEAAQRLIEEADTLRAQADTFRNTTIAEARAAAERITTAARAERAEAEAWRKRVTKEVVDREERLAGDERDFVKRKKALIDGEAALKSDQEKLRVAEREAEALRSAFQAKLVAVRKIAEAE